jgi:phosphate acetyltransferase
MGKDYKGIKQELVKMDIIKLINKKAKEKKRKILLIEGEDERVIEAASLAVKNNICTPVLLGNKKNIIKTAREKRFDLKDISIEDNTEQDFDGLALKLYDIRKNKGTTVQEAKKLLQNPNYLGALFVKLGEYDGAVGGCKFSTADWMRPVFQIIGPKKGVSTISAICFFVIKDNVYFFSDTDFNIMPDSNQLAEIAINANDFVRGLGIKPKIALLSHSTKGSGEHESLIPIRAALQIVKGKRKDIIIDGEIQLDAAVNPESAKRKCPNSILEGNANVLIFPNIAVGNVLTHALFQWTDYKFVGSFPLGLTKPVMNGGRSFNSRQIYDLIVACAMECNL